MSDCLCLEAGLSVIEHSGGEYVSRGEYKAAEKGESWKFRLINMLDNAIEASKTKEEFILYMELHGYGVKLTDSRYNITYTTPEGFKCRDNKLHDKKYTREAMEDGFIHSGKAKSFESGREAGTRNGWDVIGYYDQAGERRERDADLNDRSQENRGQQRNSIDDDQSTFGANQKLSRERKQIIRSDDRSR